MKSRTAGTLSGCIVWIIGFGILGTCFFPAAMVVGGATAATNFAMHSLEPIICPVGSTARSYSYPSTTTDQYGNSQPSTAYEMHCIDANGVIVKKDPVLFAFVWTGIIAVIGLVIAALLAFALAAPVGIWIARISDRNKKSNHTANIKFE